MRKSFIFNQQSTTRNSTRGFTLIEIIVSLAIFSIVAVIAVGALVRVTGANRQAQAIQSGVDNLSFILDAFSRELRTGTQIHCYYDDAMSSSCASGAFYSSENGFDTVIISFVSGDTGDTYAYKFHQDTSGNITIANAEPVDLTRSDFGFHQLNSDSVHITNYKIGLFNNADKSQYTWAYLDLRGYAGKKAQDQSTFDVQSSVSQRITG